MEQVRAATSESNPNRTETNHSIIGRLDLEDGVSVAIKKGYYGDLSEDGRSGDVRDIRRLRREIDNLRRVVDNPYVVDLVDYADEDDHEPWLAMEYMDGGDLRTVTGELSLRRALWTALCIVDAIDYVHHECHVAHRDLKPRNILLRSTDDGWDVPKIADWGTARVMTKDPSIDRVGTSRYAAPEQTNDIQEPTGRKTDIFQLSIVLYELFVGEHPYGETIHEVNKNRLSTPTRPSKKLPGLPTALDDLLLRGMENHPDDRPRAERFNYVLGRLYSDLIGS
jgi:molecular chaperone DnaK/serine/threonine-protein kinase